MSNACASLPVHQIEELAAMQQIYSRQLFGAPPLKLEPVLRLRRLGETPAKKITCHGLHAAPLFGSALFQQAEQPIVKSKRCPLHALECVP